MPRYVDHVVSRGLSMLAEQVSRVNAESDDPLWAASKAAHELGVSVITMRKWTARQPPILEGLVEIELIKNGKRSVIRAAPRSSWLYTASHREEWDRRMNENQE